MSSNHIQHKKYNTQKIQHTKIQHTKNTTQIQHTQIQHTNTTHTNTTPPKPSNEVSCRPNPLKTNPSTQFCKCCTVIPGDRNDIEGIAKRVRQPKMYE
jgi:hypothetical protein